MGKRPQAKPPANQLAGKKLFGPQFFFSPFGACGPQTFNSHCAVLLGFLTHVLSASLLRKDCAHLQPPCSARPHFRRGSPTANVPGNRPAPYQHKPKLSTLRRARQIHQGDFRLTLVSQNQNAKPCSEIPSALAYERMMSFQVSWLTASLFHTSSRDRDLATTCIVAGAKQVSAKGLQQSQTISKKTFQVLKSFFPACLTLNGPLKSYLVGTNLVKSPR